MLALSCPQSPTQGNLEIRTFFSLWRNENEVFWSAVFRERIRVEESNNSISLHHGENVFTLKELIMFLWPIRFFTSPWPILMDDCHFLCLPSLVFCWYYWKLSTWERRFRLGGGCFIFFILEYNFHFSSKDRELCVHGMYVHVYIHMCSQ